MEELSEGNGCAVGGVDWYVVCGGETGAVGTFVSDGVVLVCIGAKACGPFVRVDYSKVVLGIVFGVVVATGLH